MNTEKDMEIHICFSVAGPNFFLILHLYYMASVIEQKIILGLYNQHLGVENSDS